MEMLGDIGAGALGVVTLELGFLLWLVLRSRHRDHGGMAADARRLGLRDSARS